jgi:hypothetical protein
MKKIYLLSCFAILSFTATAQSQGPNSPTTAVSLSTTPGTPWNNPTNVYAADIQPASCTLSGYPACSGTTCYYSTGIAATGFGFSIPPTDNIDGIVVEIRRRSVNSLANLTDSTVMLLKAGALTGINQASATVWSLSYAYASYGSATDLWGTTWTAADINDPNFGLYFSVFVGNNTTGPPQVDHIRITVYHSAGTTGTSSIKSGNIKIYPNPAGESVSVELADEENKNAETKVTLLNVIGEELLSQKFVADKTILATNKLVPGVYFVRVSNAKGSFLKKIVKQ